jgi:hypothetical protein
MGGSDVGACKLELLVGFGPSWIWAFANGVIGLDVVVDESVEQKLLAHVLEEVLVAPSFEHSVGDFDGTQVTPRGQHGRLVIALMPSDLAKLELAAKEAHLLVGHTSSTRWPSMMVGWRRKWRRATLRQSPLR